jgi:mRNA interferase MazF
MIVSPDEFNTHLQTVVIAPMTTSGRVYRRRIRRRFQNLSDYVVLDQLGIVDRVRLLKRVGALSAATSSELLGRLQDLFAK